MESSHRLLLFFALLLVTLQSAHSQKVDLRPSKIILLPEDRNVTLQCIPSGLQDDPYNVVVITARDRTLYNSSETNKKASVSVINKTTIEYFDVAEGLSEVRCRINNTVSQEGTTIFAVGAVQLVHDAWNHSSTSPEQQQQQTSSGTSSNNNNEANNGNGTKSTLIRCPYSIQPNVTGVVLSLLVNGTEVGRFSPNSWGPPSFSVPATLPGLTVTNETILVYRVVLDPKDFAGHGKFKCLLQVSYGSTTVTVASPEWNTSGSGSLLISSFILLISVFSVLVTFY